MVPGRGTGPVPRVAVCAATYRRPVGLARLLEGVAKLDVPPGVELGVVVVDNDPEAPASAVVERARLTCPWRIDYVIEPRTGLSFVRNRAVEQARDATFVAFIDDDEVPEPRWLVELLGVQAAANADVVVGPVLPMFEELPPRWVLDGGFFEPQQFVTGHRMTWAVTNNVLVRRTLFDDVGPFSDQFARSGGEDTHFFTRCRERGALMVWANEARVVETIPSSRVNVGWLVRRQYRRGNTLSLVLVERTGSRARRLKRMAHAAVRLVEGSVLVVAGAARGRAVLVRGLQRLAFGAGLLTGLAGVRYEEYRGPVHGR